MRAIKRICDTSDVDSDIVTRRVANAAAKIGGYGRQERLGRQRPRLFDQPVLIARELRIAVHAIELESHPLRSEIPLFEHIGADPAERGYAPSRHMVGTAIAEQQDVRDLVLAKEIVEEHRPIAEPPAEVGRRFGPVDTITTTD